MWLASSPTVQAFRSGQAGTGTEEGSGLDMKMVILFKSGKTLTFKVDEFTVQGSTVTGEITRIHHVWSGNPRSRLVRVDLNEVAAVYRKGKR